MQVEVDHRAPPEREESLETGAELVSLVRTLREENLVNLVLMELLAELGSLALLDDQEVEEKPDSPEPLVAQVQLVSRVISVKEEGTATGADPAQWETWVDPEDPVTEGSLGETVFRAHLVDLVLLVTGVKMADLAEMDPQGDQDPEEGPDRGGYPVRQVNLGRVCEELLENRAQLLNYLLSKEEAVFLEMTEPQD